MASPPTVESSTLSSPPVTILVADDCADTRDFLTVMLTAEGYRVLTADNGADTLELMRAHLPNAVLLDLMMPTSADGGFSKSAHAIPISSAFP